MGTQCLGPSRFTIKAIAGTGFLAAALALIPDAQAAPFKTGGYDCVADSAGIAQSAGAVDGAPAGAPVAGHPGGGRGSGMRSRE
jgi:hypothetical protein